MRLKKITGCICDSLTAELNGEEVEEINMTQEQRQKTIDAICSWLKRNPDQLNYVMQDLIETFATDFGHDSEPCECCGDTVYTWIWDI